MIINVKWFGARGDGTADDGPAIRRAIACIECNYKGGVLFFPGGCYRVHALPKITPITDTIPDGNPIVISYGNVVVCGQSKETTKIIFYDVTGESFDTHWQMINGEVFRGSGFYIKAGAKVSDAFGDIVFKDIEIDGGLSWTNCGKIKADPITGDGWDITHKGLCFSSGHNKKITIDNCNIHSFGGELIYRPGPNSDGIYIVDTSLSKSNGNGIAAGDTKLIKGCELSDFASHGVELDTNLDIDILDNTFSNCGLNSIGVLAKRNLNVIRNTIHPVGRALYIGTEFSGDISDNIIIIDSEVPYVQGYRAAMFLPSFNLGVKRNKLVCHSQRISTGFFFSGGRYKHTVVEDNSVVRTEFAKQQDIAVGNGFDLQAVRDVSPDFTFQNNTSDSVYDYTIKSQSMGVLLTDTTDTTIAEIPRANFMQLPVRSTLCSADIHVSVKEATDLSILITWKNVDGEKISKLIHPPQATDAGEYIYPSYSVVTFGYVRVIAKTSIPNSAVVSAKLQYH